MARIQRIDVGDEIYHVINRANARSKIFDTNADYRQFEIILEEAVEKFDMRLIGYCIMPNHWHLVLYPKADGDLSLFMAWLTNTHTRRWHTSTRTIGYGHLYQGRYKSFLYQTSSRLLVLMRYVERNAKRAKLCNRAEDWEWSSGYRKLHGSDQQKKFLSVWPVQISKDYSAYLNEDQSEEEVEVIRSSIDKNIPLGDTGWIGKMVDTFKLGQTQRGVGRPKNGG